MIVPAYLNILFNAISENVKMRIQLNLMSRGYSGDFDEQDRTLTLGPNPYLVLD